MGQKVDPNGLRIGVIKPWEAKWYADKKNFADCLVEDDKIRKHIKNKYYDNPSPRSPSRERRTRSSSASTPHVPPPSSARQAQAWSRSPRKSRASSRAARR